MKDDIPRKWQAKESWGSLTHIRQIDLKSKKTTRQRWALYNEKGTTDQKHILNVNTYVPTTETQRHYSNY